MALVSSNIVIATPESRINAKFSLVALVPVPRYFLLVINIAFQTLFPELHWSNTLPSLISLSPWLVETVLMTVNCRGWCFLTFNVFCRRPWRMAWPPLVLCVLTVIWRYFLSKSIIKYELITEKHASSRILTTYRKKIHLQINIFVLKYPVNGTCENNGIRERNLKQPLR